MLPDGCVLQGPPAFTLGDALREMGCPCGLTLMHTVSCAVSNAARQAKQAPEQTSAPTFTAFETARLEALGRRSTPQRPGEGYVYVDMDAPSVLRRCVAPVLDNCGFVDPKGVMQATPRSDDMANRVASFSRGLRLLSGEGLQMDDAQIAKRFVDLLTRLRRACGKPSALQGDWLLSGELKLPVWQGQQQLRADVRSREEQQKVAAALASDHAVGASAARAAHDAGEADTAAARAGDFDAAMRSDRALVGFAEFLMRNPGARETAQVAVDMCTDVLSGNYAQFNIFKRGLHLASLIKHQADALADAGRGTSGGAASVSKGVGSSTPGAVRARRDLQDDDNIENVHPNVSATPQTREKQKESALGKRPFGDSCPGEGGPSLRHATPQ